MKTLEFQMSRRTLFGPGALGELPDALSRVGTKKPMIVTDPGIVAAGILERVGAGLDEAGIAFAVFDQVESDPRVEVVESCHEAVEKEQADLLIGLGGGSSLDVAKVAAILATNGGAPLDYAGIGKVPAPGLPTVLIPTTAGTGSEVTPIAVLSDTKEHLKKGVVSPHLHAEVALVDPELTLGLPPNVTAFTGMDALTHAIEAYTNKYAHPFIDTLALEAIRLIGGNLRRAVACGDDLEARTAMALGSTYGGMCLGPVNTAAVHALAYPLGGTFSVPHGVANSLLLPYVMQFNLMSDLPKYARVAEAMGEATAGLSRREAAQKAVATVRALAADIGIVSRIRDLDIPEDAIPEMAAAAMKVTRLLNNNPRGMRREDAEQIYRNAY
jgi:alcohol dehydrogenase class IV